MKTIMVVCCAIFLVAWGVQLIRRPESLRSGFDDAYLKTGLYLMFVQTMGVVAIIASGRLLWAYFGPA